MKNIVQNVKVITLGLIVAAGVSYALAWTGAPGTPPANNVSAPLNVGTSIQTKFGSLILNGSTTEQWGTGLTVFGKTIFEGSVQINDGSQGIGKVLQSVDSNGNATWVSTSTLGINGGGNLNSSSTACAWTPSFRVAKGNSPMYAPSGTYIAGIDYDSNTGGNDGIIRFYYCPGSGGIGSASGVSQIIAGTNVTISPSGGAGAVTINASNAPVATGSVIGGWYGAPHPTPWGNYNQTGNGQNAIYSCPSNSNPPQTIGDASVLCIAK